MKLPAELLFLTLSLLSTATPSPIEPQSFALHRRSASFLSLRGLTTLSQDYSAAESYSHPTKFFHESTFSPHYDGRFAASELPHDMRLFHLRLMLKAYIDMTERIGIRTWLMHGCLLGWWWNARIMPWDSDVDVMVDETGIQELGSWWNMSVHHFTAHDLGLNEDTALSVTLHSRDDGEEFRETLLYEQAIKTGKKYLLEVNPHYTNTSTTDKENVIDARWIDTSTGLFIDITTLHVQPIVIPPYDSNPPSPSDDEDTDDVELYTKDQHAYSFSQMFPLRTTTFENITVHVPYDYEELLLDEYGPKAITQRWFKGWKFDEERHEWVLDVEGDGDQTPLAKKEDMGYMIRIGERDARGRSRYASRES